MSSSVWLGVVLLGGLGAVSRVLLDEAVDRRIHSVFPYGILAVNLLGSFLAGVLYGTGITGSTVVLVSTALLGSFTTFSTWVFDTRRLFEWDRSSAAVANLVGSVVGGFLLVAAGAGIGNQL